MRDFFLPYCHFRLPRLLPCPASFIESSPDPYSPYPASHLRQPFDQSVLGSVTTPAIAVAAATAGLAR